MSEPKLFADANDLPGDRLEEDQVLLVVLANLRVDEVVPDEVMIIYGGGFTCSK